MSHSAPPPVAERETVYEYLTVRQVRLRPDLERILPVGEVDLVTAPTLQDALSDAERRGVPNMVVDLTEVRFLALVGARVLHNAAARSTGTGRKVALVAPNPIVKRVLNLTDVTGVLPTYGTVANAVSALDPTS